MRGNEHLESSPSEDGAAHAGPQKFPAPDQIFRQYDRDADGKLALKELGLLLRSLGFSDEESDQMRVEMDRNSDAVVSSKEFRTYLMVPAGTEEQPAAEQPADSAPQLAALAQPTAGQALV